MFNELLVQDKIFMKILGRPSILLRNDHFLIFILSIQWSQILVTLTWSVSYA